MTGGGIFYWIYGRIDPHVMASDDELMAALDDYADAHLKGGRAAVTDELRDAIRAEHADARDLYQQVARGF